MTFGIKAGVKQALHRLGFTAKDTLIRRPAYSQEIPVNLLSGPGIERIYWALCLAAGSAYHGYSAAEIQAHAAAGSDAMPMLRSFW